MAISEHKREYNKAYREKNKTEYNRYMREYKKSHPRLASGWYERNKEHHRITVRKWYERNREKVRLDNAKWRKSNPERHLATRKACRANRRAAGKIDLRFVRLLADSQEGLCYYCKEPLIGVTHLDHKTPISRGGDNSNGNLCLACPHCNLTKSAKTEEEYKLSRQDRRLAVNV